MCIFCAAFCLFSFVVVCVACMERERELVEIERACIKGGVTCVFCFFVVVVAEVGWMVGLLLCMERERVYNFCCYCCCCGSWSVDQVLWMMME